MTAACNDDIAMVLKLDHLKSCSNQRKPTYDVGDRNFSRSLPQEDRVVQLYKRLLKFVSKLRNVNSRTYLLPRSPEDCCPGSMSRSVAITVLAASEAGAMEGRLLPKLNRGNFTEI